MREFTVRAFLLGSVVSIALAAASAYVGLKVGLSVNASIPAAVMALLLFRPKKGQSTLLESNIVQSIGSAGQSLAAGMIFTIPALFLLDVEPTILEMSIWGAIGGVLGVCFMVPLRRVLIVRERDVLPYPEGIACAAVLQSGQQGREGARAVFQGAIVGGAFRLLTGLGFFPETASTPAAPALKLQASLSAEPALLGVGYILGPKVASVMISGALLAGLVVIPAIGFFGAGADNPVAPATAKPVAEMSPAEIHAAYVKYIGAGAVAAGGLIALIRSVPAIVSSMWHIMGGVLAMGRRSLERTDRDIPSPILLLLIVSLALAMWSIPQLRLGPIGAAAVAAFGFFFVTVASRIVGLVGSSSNPASGMTIATLLATCLAFKYFAGEGDLLSMKAACLAVGAIVCSAICVAGDMSQDLKTGNLVGGTPWKQELGEMVGALTAVAVIAAVILLLGRTQGFALSPDHPHPLPAPQANIMRMLVDGVFEGHLPWVLILIGIALAVVIELLGVASLPFAVGFYLPMALTTPIMAGGIVRWFVHRNRAAREGEAPVESLESDAGTLTASGLVAGNGLMGIGLVAIAALIAWLWGNPRWLDPTLGREIPVTPLQFVPWLWTTAAWLPNRWGLAQPWWNALAIGPFVVLVSWLLVKAGQRNTPAKPSIQ